MDRWAEMLYLIQRAPLWHIVKTAQTIVKKLSLRDIVSEVYKTAEILLAMSQGAAPVHYFCCMSLHKRSH